MSSHYDIIIIGSGAGGGTMALALAPTGKRILLLERGNYLPREQDNWDPDAVFVFVDDPDEVAGQVPSEGDLVRP